MAGDDARPFDDTWDPDYFAATPWAERVGSWLARNRGSFAAGNEALIRRMLNDPETGLRVIVNIGAAALLRFLEENRYRNLYERPVIGDTAPEVPATRVRVDTTLGLGEHTYFAAVALGGTGLRFYGEYCMVLKEGEGSGVDANPRLFDRDSYDIVEAPLGALDLGRDDLLGVLGGRWSDVVEMALMRVLPQIDNDSRLVTSGTVSETVLRDQEYIEVHLDAGFGRGDLEEVRQSPDEASIDLTIAERRRNSLLSRLVDAEWVRRRAAVARALDEYGIEHRIVTLHGRGYQWK